jgi:dolichyl-diphosphooligosaccharide--protein glycosyltransferase
MRSPGADRATGNGVDDPPTPRGRIALGGAAVALAAIATRLHNLAGIYLDEATILFGTDPYYHLRRIELAIHDWFAIPQFDSYVNFPTGATIDWPPGFDVLMAAGYLVVAPFLPDDVGLVAVLAAMIPVLGALAAVGVFALATRLYGLRAGLWAGLALALMAGPIDYTTVGRVDHHAVEPLCLLGLLAAYEWSARERGGLFRPFAAGAAMGLAPGFWPGAIAFSVPLLLAWLLDGRKDPRAWRDGRVAFLAAAAFAALLATSTPWGREGSLAYYALSLFQPLVFLAFAAVLTLVQVLPARWSAAGAAMLGVAVLALEPSRAALLRVLAYLFTSEAQISTVLESTPPLEMGLGYTLVWLSPWILALPVVVFFAFWSGDTPGRRVVALAALLMGVLGLLQLRFAPLLAVPFCIALGGALDRAVARLGSGLRVSAIASLVFLASMGPSAAPSLSFEPKVLPHLVRSLDGLFWLRDVPRPTSHYLEPSQRPEYGVLSSWVWGHWITAISRKPNVANPLGQSDTNLEGVRNSARVLLATSQEEGAAVAEALGVRFLFLTPLTRGLESMVLQLGRDFGDYAKRHADGARTVEQGYLDSLHSQLYLPLDEIPASARFRLVYTGHATHTFLDRERPYVKIFQLVPGAALTGRCTADAVTLEMPVRTNTGRDLPFRSRIEPGPDGEFELTTPYATEPIPAGTSGREPATIRCGERSAAVAIPHAAVETGVRIPVSFDPES